MLMTWLWICKLNGFIIEFQERLPFVPIEIQEARTRKLVKLILKIIACLLGMLWNDWCTLQDCHFYLNAFGGDTEPNFTEEWAKSGHPTVTILAALANSGDLCNLLIGIYWTTDGVCL